MNIKHIFAVVTLFCAGAAQAISVVLPGGSLGELSETPSQFISATKQTFFTPFSTTYHFDLGADSDVFGSVAALSEFQNQLLAPISFLGASIDGVDLLAQPTPTGGLSFGKTGLLAGAHWLTVVGISMPGVTAFTGSIYAKSSLAVPEPSALNIVLAGLGVVGGLSARRRAVDALA
jgi:hypothetical protein